LSAQAKFHLANMRSDPKWLSLHNHEYSQTYFRSVTTFAHTLEYLLHALNASATPEIDVALLDLLPRSKDMFLFIMEHSLSRWETEPQQPPSLFRPSLLILSLMLAFLLFHPFQPWLQQICSHF
jgi:hypothetical protein